jgi:hypothetical protein
MIGDSPRGIRRTTTLFGGDIASRNRHTPHSLFSPPLLADRIDQ